MARNIDRKTSPTAGLQDLIERCTQNAKAKRKAKLRANQKNNAPIDPFKDHPRLGKLRAELLAGTQGNDR